MRDKESGGGVVNAWRSTLSLGNETLGFTVVRTPFVASPTPVGRRMLRMKNNKKGTHLGGVRQKGLWFASGGPQVGLAR